MDEEKILSFNVGGMVFQTLRATIERDKNSTLYSIINSELKTLDKKGRIFLDRDPEIFRHILYYLRTGSLEHDLSTHKLEDIWREADFLQLNRCVEAIQGEIKMREWNNARNWRLSSKYHTKYVIILMYTKKERALTFLPHNLDVAQAVKFEIPANPPRRVLYKIKGSFRVIDCTGRALPGLSPTRNSPDFCSTTSSFTSSDKLDELAAKSVFFLIDLNERDAEVSLFQLMQMDHLVHKSWTYFWDKIPDYSKIKDNSCLEIWSAPSTFRTSEIPTK